MAASASTPTAKSNSGNAKAGSQRTLRSVPRQPAPCTCTLHPVTCNLFPAPSDAVVAHYLRTADPADFPCFSTLENLSSKVGKALPATFGAQSFSTFRES